MRNIRSTGASKASARGWSSPGIQDGTRDWLRIATWRHSMETLIDTLTTLQYDKARLTREQQWLFDSEIARTKKSVLVAYLFWWFLAGVGAHQFYLGHTERALIRLAPTALAFLGGVLVGLRHGGGWAVVLAVVGAAVLWVWDAVTLPRQTQQANAWLEHVLVAQLLGEEI